MMMTCKENQDKDENGRTGKENYGLRKDLGFLYVSLAGREKVK